MKPVEGWIKDPFVPENDNDGNIYGLGSNDAGASVVSLMQAFFYLSSCEQPYNLIFAATAEEEVSGKGGIELLLSELPRVDFAIVGEPTGMHPAIAEKGLMVLDGKACGKAGHVHRCHSRNRGRIVQTKEWWRLLPRFNTADEKGIFVCCIYRRQLFGWNIGQ